ncbi:MAG: hypothetical protein R8J94_11070 [Acidimicrobiia bacterium]|nr:hypothetical protein [Acidimicrobiia bacterium]
MSPCPLSAYAALLQPLANWCLDTFGDGPPMLIGVVLGDAKVHFHPVELDDEHPIDDLADLAAPDRWDVLVVVAPTAEIDCRVGRGTVAHAVDRFGASATELDEPCGRRRALRLVRGTLHDACIELFRPVM